MALEFPKNQDVFDARVSNTFGRIWLGFFEAVYRKFRAVDALTNISTADMGAAGGAYSQTEMQKQNDLINELKAKVNALQAAIKT